MSVDGLAAFADAALAGLAHRRLDFDLIDAAGPLRQTFEASGWKAMRLSFMRHETRGGPGCAVAVEEIPYDLAHELRMAWHLEHPYEGDPQPLHAQFREVALRRSARVLAVKEMRAPIALAQFLEHDGASAEITEVYVHPDHRGRGLGTANTRAAIEAVGSVKDLWIAADDETSPRTSMRGSAFARHGRRWSSSERLTFSRPALRSRVVGAFHHLDRSLGLRAPVT